MPDLRKGVLQQSKTFSIEFQTEIGQSSDIPARMRETRDDARPNGSPTSTITIGIVVVACLAARVAGVANVTRTSGLRRTR
jgi:hypothetical protein